MRLQPPLLTHASALAMQSPCSPNINPSFVHSPCILVPDTAQIIKAELTACTQQQSYLFVPRHGGSGEPALPRTEVLDQKQKEKRLSHTGNKECSELISVCKDRTSYGRVSRASPRFFYGSNPRRKRSQESSRGLWTLRNQTPKDLREYSFKIIRCWS